MFSRNIFRGILKIHVVKQSKKCPKKKKKKKKNHLLQKALEDNITLTVNKCVKLKSKVQLKCFKFLKSVIYLGYQPPYVLI